MSSWNQRPFVDVIVANGEEQCPLDHPEDLVYDIWPGTCGHCDCLRREGDRNWTLDKECDRGNNCSEKSEDCYDRPGLAPIQRS